jgi:hypothetical protein
LTSWWLGRGGRSEVGRRELRCGPFPAAPTGGRPRFVLRRAEARAMQVDTDEGEIIERVAALDVGP